MRKRGVYGSALIKRRCYFYKKVCRYGVNESFSTKNGDVLCLSGEWDEIEFNIFVMKEPDYNIMIMSTFKGLTVLEDHKEEKIMVNGEAGSKIQVY